jgi:hypothetical protein
VLSILSLTLASSNTNTKIMKNAIETALRSRTTEELKNDIIIAMKSDEEGSVIVFSIGLSVLEEKLTEDEYQKFEGSL